MLPAGHAASPPARLRTCGLQELGRRGARAGASGGVRPPAVPVGFPGLHPCGVVSAGRGAGQPGRGSRPKSRLGKAAELSPAVAGVRSSWPLLSTCPVLTQVAAAALGHPPWPHVPPLGHVLVTRAIGPGRRDTSECGRWRRGPPRAARTRGCKPHSRESGLGTSLVGDRRLRAVPAHIPRTARGHVPGPAHGGRVVCASQPQQVPGRHGWLLVFSCFLIVRVP